MTVGRFPLGDCPTVVSLFSTSLTMSQVHRARGRAASQREQIRALAKKLMETKADVGICEPIPPAFRAILRLMTRMSSALYYVLARNVGIDLLMVETGRFSDRAGFRQGQFGPRGADYGVGEGHQRHR